MAKINVLDKHVAELIAAGEVVERPASVVKELCENAVDAGATAISVSIESGGVALISIQDNGCGIDAECVATAFLRHATSKVQTQSDLEDIHTLGFRGEALASIASVAHVELLTRAENAEFASLYRISAGEEEEMSAAARPVGTTITVKNLFYNTPARMKFLKKDVSEGNFVSDIVGHLALSHPEISFRLTREGKVQFHTPGDGDLRGAAYEVLTRDFAKELLALDYKEGNYTVIGLVTAPKDGRASRAMQYFYVNGRYVKNRTMMAALERAYSGIMMQGKYPGGVLSLTMPPELVDVNVHPAKTEIRFAREGEIFDIVYKAVKSVLLVGDNANKELMFTKNTLSIDAVKQTDFTPVLVSYNTGSEASLNISFTENSHTCTSDNTLFSHSFVSYDTNMPPSDTPPVVAPICSEAQTPTQTRLTVPSLNYSEESTNSEVDLRVVGEIFNTYIVTQYGEELCLIDKHAAHERILYEALAADSGDVASQLLLEPVTATLNAEEKNALLDAQDLLSHSGIELEDFGGASVLVRTVPADMEPDNVESLICELAHTLSLGHKTVRSEKAQWVMHSIACRAAIKAGDHSREAELIKLAQDVLSGKIPPFCPHGRPVVLRISRKELEKQFGRQG